MNYITIIIIIIIIILLSLLLWVLFIVLLPARLLLLLIIHHHPHVIIYRSEVIFSVGSWARACVCDFFLSFLCFCFISLALSLTLGLSLAEPYFESAFSERGSKREAIKFLITYTHTYTHTHTHTHHKSNTTHMCTISMNRNQLLAVRHQHIRFMRTCVCLCVCVCVCLANTNFLIRSKVDSAFSWTALKAFSILFCLSVLDVFFTLFESLFISLSPEDCFVVRVWGCESDYQESSHS